ncbi:MAG: type II toxin-antitoxin system PemK/MazF family toxin [Wenzhouxiangellaceae bacterium]
MRRGEVWLANLNPPRGREIGKIRPVVVVQAPELDADTTPMVVVLPMTTRVIDGLKRCRVAVKARDRLKQDSQIVTDQPRALDRHRVIEGPLATLSDAEIAAVENGLRIVMGLL